jgi:hypothetical protein
MIVKNKEAAATYFVTRARVPRYVVLAGSKMSGTEPGEDQDVVTVNAYAT